MQISIEVALIHSESESDSEESVTKELLKSEINVSVPDYLLQMMNLFKKGRTSIEITVKGYSVVAERRVPAEF